MEETMITNIEEQDNYVEVTDVTCSEANEAKNNDFAIGALAGASLTLAVAGLVKLAKWGKKKAKEKEAAKKQAKDVYEAEFVDHDAVAEESED